MTSLNTLRPAFGSRKKRKRVGRGESSGWGKTSGRGNKGQKARSGGKIPPWFEGGQMPLTRRVPKRGFKNINRIIYQIINIEQLQKLGFEPDTAVTPEVMQQSGILKERNTRVKILGRGTIDKPLKVSAHAFSKTATAKIVQAGGKIEVIYQ